MNLIQLLLSVASAGAHVVLWLLVALSVLSIAVILERGLWFGRRRLDARATGLAVLEKLRAHDRAGAKAVLGATRAPEAEIIHDALEWLDAGPEAVAEVIEGAIKERRRALERGLLFLGTLGNNAPFIGLFGTVLGIITAFQELGAASAGAMGNVMTGIAEALTATAVGIFVAIPAVIAFNIFQRRVVEIEENAAAMGHLVVAELRRAPAPEG